MTRAEVLTKLLRLGSLEPLHAMHVCGWPAKEFDAALQKAMEDGSVRQVRGYYNHLLTRLEAA